MDPDPGVGSENGNTLQSDTGFHWFLVIAAFRISYEVASASCAGHETRQVLDDAPTSDVE